MRVASQQPVFRRASVLSVLLAVGSGYGGIEHRLKKKVGLKSSLPLFN